MADGNTWTDRGKLKISNADGLLVHNLLRAKGNKAGFPELPLMDMTFASAKHRVTNIPPQAKKEFGADTMNIRITNIGDTEMKVMMRLFAQEGALLWTGTLVESLSPMVTLQLTSDNLAKMTGVTLKGRAFAEIFPEDVKQRCNGKMLIQGLIRQWDIKFAPLSNVTPQD